MKVFILFVETNTGDAGGDSDGWIHSVHATYAGAKAARDAFKAEELERDPDLRIWPADDEPENPDADLDWEACYQIQEREVQTT